MCVASPVIALLLSLHLNLSTISLNLPVFLRGVPISGPFLHLPLIVLLGLSQSLPLAVSVFVLCLDTPEKRGDSPPLNSPTSSPVLAVSLRQVIGRPTLFQKIMQLFLPFAPGLLPRVCMDVWGSGPSLGPGKQLPVFITVLQAWPSFNGPTGPDSHHLWEN